MARPRVTVVAPEAVFVGQPFVLRAEVATPTEAKVDAIAIRATGKQGWSVGAGKTRTVVAETFPELAVHVMGEGVLAAGAITPFEASLTLPPGTAPSHDLRPAHARLHVRVHVMMPWRVDVRHDVELVVRVAPPADLSRTPLAAKGPPDAGPGAPRIELALASTRIIAGEALTGTVAVFHLDDAGPRRVTLALTPTLHLQGNRRHRTVDADGVTLELILPPGSAGQSVPFQFLVPSHLTPSFSTVTHTLTWSLEAKTGSLFTGKVKTALALEVIDAVARGFAPALPAPPQLGDEQIARAFRAAVEAADGALVLMPGARGVEQPLGDATIGVAYSYRGKDEAVLASRIEYPSLGLGLRVTPGSLLQSAFIHDIEVDIAAWDRAHYADARDGAQAQPFLRAVVTRWAHAEPLGPLVRWDDREIVFELPVTAVTPARIAVLVAALAALAEVITAATALVGPPPGVATDVAAWHALAAELDGRFAPGDLGLEGTYGQLPVDTTYAATDASHVIDVAVGATNLASGKLAAVTLAVARPARASTTIAGLDDETTLRVLDVLQRMPLEVANLQVAAGIARAQVVLDRTAALDPARIRSVIDGLRAVLAALDVAPGPYR